MAFPARALARTSAGVHFLFSLDAGGVLSWRTLSGPGSAPGDRQAVANGIVRFALDIDRDDRPHVACLDRVGGIVYWRWEGRSWRSVRLFHGGGVEQAGQPSIAVMGRDAVCVVYTLYRHHPAGGWAIVAHRCAGAGCEPGVVIDRGEAPRANPVAVDRDAAGVVYLVYRAQEGERRQVCYQVIEPARGGGGRAVLAEGGDDRGPPHVVAGHEGAHVIWRHSARDGDGIGYMHVGSGRWCGPERTAVSGRGRIEEIALLGRRRELSLVWIEQGALRWCRSTDGGRTWSDAFTLATPATDAWVAYAFARGSRGGETGEFRRTFGTGGPFPWWVEPDALHCAAAPPPAREEPGGDGALEAVPDDAADPLLQARAAIDSALAAAVRAAQARRAMEEENAGLRARIAAQRAEIDELRGSLRVARAEIAALGQERARAAQAAQQQADRLRAEITRLEAEIRALRETASRAPSGAPLVRALHDAWRSLTGSRRDDGR